MHMDYLVPFNKDLNLPYRANDKLKQKIDYIFRHPSLPLKHKALYINVTNSGSKGLLNDMARVAIGMCNYYLTYPQQFGGALENIQFQILHRMWKQTFKHSMMQQLDELDQYYSLKIRLLGIENGFWDELIRVCLDKDYIQSGDDMVKKRHGVSLRGRTGLGTHEGSDNFEYLCGLD